ncbi:helix-turn-helix transcriptional regulator [Streptomyces candidus]|uniref:Transcriptional regulator with XRE-family HTH domain n=1 Tax=Streptomyces candidus TaxID=67283 RepID=A0A7X0HGI2_9ACTN|nr:helix-turn-helix transcriptional regulator [Streptomyces candidus]MBB6437210.1 transcriptional regulator with XRE-family HTH domain [Streptomyces candidus]
MRIEEVIGANVARLRDGKELSQSQLGEALAEHLGKPWSRQAVSAAEKGRRAFTAADLLALSRTLDVSVPTLFLLKDWRGSNAVELADGISVSADEYRDRILHDTDAQGALTFMTHAGVQELTQTLLRMKTEQLKAGDQIDGLLSTLFNVSKAVAILSETEEIRAQETLRQLNESTRKLHDVQHGDQAVNDS